MSITDKENRANGSKAQQHTEFDNLPADLKSLQRWINWRWGVPNAHGKRDKKPVNPHSGQLADVSDLKTWGNFPQTLTFLERGNADGIGFVFTSDDPYCGIDLDYCRDPVTGTVERRALEIVERFPNAYWEISPSGTGLHGIMQGSLPPGRRKKDRIEMYERGRYFTMSGDYYTGEQYELGDYTTVLLALHQEVFGESSASTGNGKPHSDSGEITQKILLALSFIPPYDYDIWIRVGMALHRADSGEEGFRVWDEWSHGCPAKYDSQVCQKKWQSFNADRENNVSLGTIIALAKEHGWDGGPCGGGKLHTKATSQSGKIRLGEQDQTQDEEYHITDEGEQSARAELPQIVVNNRHLPDVSSEALAALDRWNQPPSIFLRSRVLVRIGQNEHEQPIIEPLSEAAVRGCLGRAAAFYKDGHKDFLKVAPPLDVVRDIMALPELPFPPLAGVTASPVLRADGTVLDAPGYDATTRLVYHPPRGFHLADIPTTPTQKEASQACKFVCDELFTDFPFCSDADRADMLACLLTPIVRPAINGNVPLCLLDKPTPGSGATLLSDLVSLIATGEPAAKSLVPEGRNGEEEWRKKITSILMDGATVTVFDNVNESISSSALAMVLTTPLWKDRILGRNETVTLPVRTCWIATANNIRLRGDLARRAYRVRIDSGTERPWTREEFRHPKLLPWVAEHRGEVLAALLTMARAWFVAGQPAGETPRMGSFEEWTRIVGGILAYAGVQNFLDNLEELYELVDDDGPQWGAFFEAWSQIFDDRTLTLAEFVRLALPVLMDAIPDSIAFDPDRIHQSKIKLGRALQKRADRIHGGYKLIRSQEGHKKTARWSVQKVEKLQE